MHGARRWLPDKSVSACCAPVPGCTRGGNDAAHDGWPDGWHDGWGRSAPQRLPRDAFAEAWELHLPDLKTGYLLLRSGQTSSRAARCGTTAVLGNTNQPGFAIVLLRGRVCRGHAGVTVWGWQRRSIGQLVSCWETMSSCIAATVDPTMSARAGATNFSWTSEALRTRCLRWSCAPQCRRRWRKWVRARTPSPHWAATEECGTSPAKIIVRERLRTVPATRPVAELGRHLPALAAAPWPLAWKLGLDATLGRCSRKIVEPPVCSETAGFTARPNVGCWLARAPPETSQIFSLAGTGLTGQGSHSTAGGSNFARAHANRGFQGSTGDPGAQEPPGLHARSLCLGRFSIALLPTPSITTSLDPTLLPSFSFPLPLVRCRFVHCCSIVVEAPWLQLGCWCH